MSTQPSKFRTRALFGTLFLVTIVATSLVTALLVNISLLFVAYYVALSLYMTFRTTVDARRGRAS
jgi:hypothetical protein